MQDTIVQDKPKQISDFDKSLNGKQIIHTIPFIDLQQFQTPENIAIYVTTPTTIK